MDNPSEWEAALQFVLKARDEASATLQQFQGHLEKTGESARRAEEGLAASAEALMKFGEAALAAYGSAELLHKSLEKSAEYEVALTKVGRTTDQSGEGLKEFGQQILQLTREIPVATAELLKISQVAGEAGSRGSDEIRKFTKEMASVGELAGVSGDRVAAAFLHISQMTGKPIEDVEKLGSVFVVLGDQTIGGSNAILHMTELLSRNLSTLQMRKSQPKRPFCGLYRLSIPRFS